MNLWWQAVDGWRCIAFLGGGCAVGQVGFGQELNEGIKTNLFFLCGHDEWLCPNQVVSCSAEDSS